MTTVMLAEEVLNFIDRRETHPVKLEVQITLFLQELGVWSTRSEIVINQKEINVTCAIGTFTVQLPHEMKIQALDFEIEPIGDLGMEDVS